MRKQELIDRLKMYLLNKGNEWRGQGSFTLFLIRYLENLRIAHDEKYDSWNIMPYLPEIMVAAFEQLRTGSDEETVRFRKMYEGEVGHDVPNITDIGESDMLNQGSAVQTTLGFMLTNVLEGDWIRGEIDAYCNAQKYVLQQTFDKFLRRVYYKGLYEIIDKCKQAGMSGEYGDTCFRTLVTGGRIMFSFTRKIDQKEGGVTVTKDGIEHAEKSVSFVAEDGDPNAFSAGLQSIYCDLITAMSLIEDVINHWPLSPKEQKEAHKVNAKVSLG